MAVIGDISVSISARTQKFEKGLRDSSKNLANFVQGVKSTALTVAGLGTALAGAAAVGIGVYVKKSLEAIDRTAKLSDRLRITTEDLVGLRHAAGLAGVGSEEFDSALQGMVRRVAETTATSGPAAAALAYLGLNAQNLSRVGAGEAFRQIAEAISKVPNQADKSAVAFEIFGKQGQELVNVLDTGRAGLDAMSAEAERLGLTFSRIDAAKVEAANDSFTRLGSLLEGAANALAIQLAPFLEMAANKLIEFGISGEGTGAKVVGAFEWILKGIAKIISFIDLLKAAWFGLETIFNSIISGWLHSLAMVVNAYDEVQFAIAGTRSEFGNFIRQFTADTDRALGESMQASTEALDAFINEDRVKSVESFFAEIRSGAEDSAKAIAKAAEEKAKLAEAMAPVVGSIASKGFGDQVGFAKFKDVFDAADQKTKAQEFRSGAFKQIDTSRISVAGLQVGQQKQEVIDPQLKETNSLLKQIKTNLGIGQVAVAG